MSKHGLMKTAQNIRTHIIRGGYAGGHAHFGGSLSSADILAVLFGKTMNISHEAPEDAERDRFILSKGHCALALYAALHEFGFISEEQMLSFNQNGGDFPSHCVMNTKYGIELSSGSLGLGLSFGIGQALALKGKSKIYVLVGNGEMNEGSFWEAAMFAGSHKLGNVCLILDDNKMQLDGHTQEIWPETNWSERLRSFGWKVEEVDGHDIDAIDSALKNMSGNAPYAVIAHTVKGHGISFMQDAPEWHHGHLSEEQYANALEELGVSV